MPLCPCLWCSFSLQHLPIPHWLLPTYIQPQLPLKKCLLNLQSSAPVPAAQGAFLGAPPPPPDPRGPLCFYSARSFLCHHTDCLSFITWVPDREVQQKAVELSLYYLLSLGQVTWPSHISVSILIQGLWNYLIECGKIAIRLCKIKLLGKRQVS